MERIDSKKKITDRWFNEEGNLNVSTKQMVALFSLLFIVISAGIFAMFILLNRTFVQFGDAYRQGYFWIAEIKHNLPSLFTGDGYPQWSWFKGTGLEVSYLTDPFNLIAALFPWKHLELGYTLMLIVKLYLAGLAFIAFAREVKLPDFACLMGAVSFVFCTFTVNIAMSQARFVIIIALLPILVLSIDRIYKGKSPLLFILTVAYCTIENSYLAYMAGLVVVIYIFLRYFAYNDSFRIKEYAARIGLFMLYGCTGILISAVVLVQRFLRVQAASMESADEGIDLLYSPQFYCDLGKHIVSEGLLDGYSYLGIPAFALIVLAVAFRKITRKNTAAVMTLILFGMMLFPFFSSMFNGFSYNSGRWYYIVPFFAVWAAAEHFDIGELKEKGNMIAMTIALAVIAVWTIGFTLIGICSMDRNTWAFIGITVLGGIAILAAIGSRKMLAGTRGKQIAVTVITCVTLVIAWNGSLYGNMGKFVHDSDMYKQLEKSTQRVATQIDDEDFYRVDQVYWINVQNEMKMPANENLYWQSKSIYLYDSKLPETLLDFNNLVGNSYGYSKRVYMLSNDNRAGLDYLFGVRYFLGNDLKNDRSEADAYASYGFEKAGNIDGVNVFRSKYDAGLGFAYDRCISRSEFEKLGRLEREQALLQAVVIPDEKMEGLSTKQITAEDIETDVRDVKYRITGTDGIEFGDGELTATKENASFSMKVEDAPAGQLIVSFDDFIRGSGSTSASFKMECTNESVRESADNELTNQSIFNIRNYDLNMGYYDGYSGTIKVSLSDTGTYRFDRIHISSMNMDLFDRYAAERSAEPFNVESYDAKAVKGSVDLDSDGIVFFSIARNSNWDVYVDGQKAEKIGRANITFMGTEVGAGHHEIELRYNDDIARLGLLMSLAGLAVGIIIALLHRRRTK
ncbi:MAG: YfhO family protein [Clostridia bacterium]|nr:YfhO family protein [Clostridia bacterium]